MIEQVYLTSRLIENHLTSCLRWDIQKLIRIKYFRKIITYLIN